MTETAKLQRAKQGSLAKWREVLNLVEEANNLSQQPCAFCQEHTIKKDSYSLCPANSCPAYKVCGFAVTSVSEGFGILTEKLLEVLKRIEDIPGPEGVRERRRKEGKCIISSQTLKGVPLEALNGGKE